MNMNVIDRYMNSDDYSMKGIVKYIISVGFSPPERRPIVLYEMGTPDARSFSRGKRGTAGTISFAGLDERQAEILMRVLSKPGSNITMHVDGCNVRAESSRTREFLGSYITFNSLQILDEKTPSKCVGFAQFTFIAESIESSERGIDREYNRTI
jgi:hypothetical protein